MRLQTGLDLWDGISAVISVRSRVYLEMWALYCDNLTRKEKFNLFNIEKSSKGD